MKRLVISAMIFLTALMLIACGDVPVQGPVDSVLPEDTSEVSETPKTDVGFSLAGGGAFSEQLVTDIQNECASLNIAARISVATSVEQQQQDISSMLSEEASVIVIVPLDIDSLETVLAECETYGAKVINAVEPINGFVSMLISPDYNDIGKKAGKCAVELFGSSGGDCMMLNTEYDSFTMQLMTDGFNAAVSEDKDVKVVSEKYCGSDEELAYTTVKAELSSKDIDFIFAQSAVLGRGAMRAAEESGKDVKVVIFGGDMDIIGAVSEGKAYASIFFGPQSLAHEAVLHTGGLIESGSYELPQYVALPVTVVKQADASGYYIESQKYAQIK